MKKTFNINLAGLIFHIDEDAFEKLDRYLSTLKQQFSGTEGNKEIITDIEARIAELFKDKITDSKEVITTNDVEEVIEVMGKPEDYIEGENVGNSYSDDDSSYESYRSNRRIFRDGDERIIGGVAAGFAAYFNTDPLWMRILFVLLFFLSGFGILVYLVLWAVIPRARTTAEKLQMRGESVNISNIEKSIKEEMEGFKKKVSRPRHRSRSHTRSENKIGSFFEEILDFILELVRFVFRFVVKLLGFIFIFLGFMLLLAMITALFTGGAIMLNGNEVNDIWGFLHILSIDDLHQNLLIAGVVLLILAPLLLLIYWGVRIIFKLPPLNQTVRGSLALAGAIGFICLFISAISLSMQFKSYAQFSITQYIEPSAEVLELKLKNDEISGQFKDLSYISIDSLDAFHEVEMDIRKSNDSASFLEIIYKSKGQNRRDAITNARMVNYEVELKPGEIILPSYYTLAEDGKFRSQRVKVVLYLIEGESIFLSPDMLDIIYDIQNVDNMWDHEMTGHSWIMTDKGLKCSDCPRKKEEKEEEAIDSLLNKANLPVAFISPVASLQRLAI